MQHPLTPFSTVWNALRSTRQPWSRLELDRGGRSADSAEMLRFLAAQTSQVL